MLLISPVHHRTSRLESRTTANPCGHTAGRISTLAATWAGHGGMPRGHRATGTTKRTVQTLVERVDSWLVSFVFFARVAKWPPVANRIVACSGDLRKSRIDDSQGYPLRVPPAGPRARCLEDDSVPLPLRPIVLRQKHVTGRCGSAGTALYVDRWTAPPFEWRTGGTFASMRAPVTWPDGRRLAGIRIPPSDGGQRTAGVISTLSRWLVDAAGSKTVSLAAACCNGRDSVAVGRVRSLSTCNFS